MSEKENRRKYTRIKATGPAMEKNLPKLPRDEQPESDFIHVLDAPKLSRFTRAWKTRGGKDPVSPVSKFFTWIMGEIGEESQSKKFSIDVCEIWISKDLAKEFKKELTAWVKKIKPWASKAYCSQGVDWMWLDIGPAQFYDGLPSWAEEGKIYIRKDWKKPPVVYITDFNTYSINNQPATLKEVEALKKQYGDELRVMDERKFS